MTNNSRRVIVTFTVPGGGSDVFNSPAIPLDDQWKVVDILVSDKIVNGQTDSNSMDVKFGTDLLIPTIFLRGNTECINIDKDVVGDGVKIVTVTVNNNRVDTTDISIRINARRIVL